MSTPAADTYLDLPLTGLQSIEASAGTGKTFTVATLVLRLLVEQQLRIEQILVVTFTEAATQELRARLRARLLLALRVLEAMHQSADAAAAASSETSSDDISDTAEADLIRQVLAAHLQAGGESLPALQRRLREAADGMDRAAVFTIHGFCLRVLREHALDSGQGFEPPQLLGNDAGLRAEIAADLWRRHASDGAAAELLGIWRGGVQALADDLRDLLTAAELLPAPVEVPPDPRPQIEAAADALASAWQAHGTEFRDALLAACEAKVLNGRSYKPDWIGQLAAELDSWSARPAAQRGEFSQPKLEMLQRAVLREKTNGGQFDKTPDSPFCDALEDWLQSQQLLGQWQQARRIALLHALRDDGRARMARRKRQLRVQTYDDLIEQVAVALDGEGGDALAQALRQQYKVALVDEFQDTDPLQWRIFKRVFVDTGEPALFLIGDPKQAIYGFRGGDVETYLRARALAQQAPELAHNFRSRPGLLRAIQALYEQAGDEAFVDPGIRFYPVQPGGRRSDDEFQRGTPPAPAPALRIWDAGEAASDDGKPLKSEPSRALATRACVAAIRDLLADETARVNGQRVAAGDIAVLVRSHRDASRMRQALAAAGIAAVAAGKHSLFATDEAGEVYALLMALQHPDDDARLRHALAGVLAGHDAAALLAMQGDAKALDAARQQLQHWRQCFDRDGVLALLDGLCARHAPRLLQLFDGERRLTNYLQLAELLQQAQRQLPGLPALLDWLGRAMREAGGGGEDDANQLRLESDARRVQIVTLHKSKGLEYPLVFLPYAGIGSQARSSGRYLKSSIDGGRSLHWAIDAGSDAYQQASHAWRQAERAEDARLLYVAMTRARHGLWLATGPFFNAGKTPLHGMLRSLPALQARTPQDIVIEHGLPAGGITRLPPQEAAAPADVRIAKRQLDSDWWVHSFSQLTRRSGPWEPLAAATEATSGAEDEALPAASTADVQVAGVQVAGVVDGQAAAGTAAAQPQLAGSAFGSALHDALELADFAAWAGWRTGDPAPAGQAPLLLQALRGRGFGGDAEQPGLELLTDLVGATLTAPLPEGGSLHAVPEDARRAEIEFHFPLAGTRVDALLRLLHAHGVLARRQDFGMRQRLAGLMTGKIDLSYHQQGQWFVLDYKSNQLPAYDPATLQAAMAHDEYDLQALIYTLALHRWLRLRLGDGYDYRRDFGGIRYLFCRGLQPQGDPAQGVHAHRFDPALVDALDALFAGAVDGDDAGGSAVPATEVHA